MINMGMLTRAALGSPAEHKCLGGVNFTPPVISRTAQRSETGKAAIESSQQEGPKKSKKFPPEGQGSGQIEVKGKNRLFRSGCQLPAVEAAICAVCCYNFFKSYSHGSLCPK